MQYSKQQENNEEKLLFKPNNQKYTRRTNVNSELKRILKANFNIEDISTHALRHTYCTRCIEAGADPMVVASLLGQSDIQEKFKTDELTKVNNYYINNHFMSSNAPKLENNSNDIER